MTVAVAVGVRCLVVSTIVGRYDASMAAGLIASDVTGDCVNARAVVRAGGRDTQMLKSQYDLPVACVDRVA